MTFSNSLFFTFPLVSLATGAVFLFAGSLSLVHAADCATAAEPADLQITFPLQIELADLNTQTSATLAFSECPEFAAQVAAGTRPPVEQRTTGIATLRDCGKYGGTLRGLRALTLYEPK